MRPLLFLDVDGVLNCLGPTVPTVQITNRKWHVELPSGSRERIAALREAFDPVWATAWGGKAHRAFQSHLNLGDTPWPRIHFGGSKLKGIIRYADGRAWAWVDDHADDGVRQAAALQHGGFVVQTDPRVGLTDEHVDALLEFAKVAV